MYFVEVSGTPFVAFRTVLTYQVAGIAAGTQGRIMDTGDQLWIRGGDAVGSSSIPGFPLNWQDDYTKLYNEKKRAGIRLLRMESSTTDMSTTSVWRYVTWEINVRTWFDCVLARAVAADTGETANATDTGQNANFAWQYGPRQWAYQRAGWTSFKDLYTLYPGKHRWVRMNNSTFDTGAVNFSLQFNPRAKQTSTSFTQP
ncbi:hypothetical protein [Treponema sp. R6D11]